MHEWLILIQSVASLVTTGVLVLGVKKVLDLFATMQNELYWLRNSKATNLDTGAGEHASDSKSISSSSSSTNGDVAS